MNELVVYKSETGFTEKYAKWIAAELGCEAKPLKKVRAEELAGYDCIIYGAGILGNMIGGLNKIKKMYQGNLVVFATGSSPYSEEVIKAIKEVNSLGDMPFFYMQSGFAFERLGFVKKMMLRMAKKMVAKKENKTEQDLFMEKALEHSFDSSDRSFTKPLIQYVRA